MGKNVYNKEETKVNIINVLEQEQLRADIPAFRAGDTVRVHVKVVEGKTERIQLFVFQCFDNIHDLFLLLTGHSCRSHMAADCPDIRIDSIMACSNKQVLFDISAILSIHFLHIRRGNIPLPPLYQFAEISPAIKEGQYGLQHSQTVISDFLVLVHNHDVIQIVVNRLCKCVQ